VTQVETENEKFMASVKKMKQEVQKRGEDVKINVDRHVNELLQKLEQVESRGEKEAKTLIESYDLAATVMDSFQCYSSELSSKGSPYDITREADGLRTRANELLKTYNNDCDGYHAPQVQTFIPSDFDQLIGSRNVVGSLQLSNAKSTPPDTTIREVGRPLRLLGYFWNIFVQCVVLLLFLCAWDTLHSQALQLYELQLHEWRHYCTTTSSVRHRTGNSVEFLLLLFYWCYYMLLLQFSFFGCMTLSCYLSNFWVTCLSLGLLLFLHKGYFWAILVIQASAVFAVYKLVKQFWSYLCYLGKNVTAWAIFTAFQLIWLCIIIFKFFYR